MSFKKSLLLLAFSTSQWLMADDYLSITLLQPSIETPASSAKPLVVQFTAGRPLNDYFSYEGRIALPIADDKINGDEYKVKNLYGAHVTFHFMPNKPFNPYATLGYTKIQVDIQDTANTLSRSEHDFTLGLGADIPIMHDLQLNLEYSDLVNKQDLDVSSLSLGVKYQF